jgi:formylglycine-generating enzyme required for sulfatase activity
LNAKTGQRYRLLSEAEWEYVARAGTRTKYSWGNEFVATKAANGSETEPVGNYAPNAFGLWAMHGSVREWVEDCYNGNYTGAPTDGSAWTNGACSLRILRGGWLSSPWGRFANGSGYLFVNWGFRVARTLSP